MVSEIIVFRRVFKCRSREEPLSIEHNHKNIKILAFINKTFFGFSTFATNNPILQRSNVKNRNLRTTTPPVAISNIENRSFFDHENDRNTFRSRKTDTPPYGRPTFYTNSQAKLMFSKSCFSICFSNAVLEKRHIGNYNKRFKIQIIWFVFKTNISKLDIFSSSSISPRPRRKPRVPFPNRCRC